MQKLLSEYLCDSLLPTGDSEWGSEPFVIEKLLLWPCGLASVNHITINLGQPCTPSLSLTHSSSTVATVRQCPAIEPCLSLFTERTGTTQTLSV